jgi:glycerol-3-phosphate acyltransferase PlsY
MQIAVGFGILIVSYLIGSIPFGLIIVKLTTGQDVREIESGRTGGTNAMRAAGFLVGATTVMLDVAKGAVSAWLAMWLVPDMIWITVLAPVMAIVGHNYSIYLIERDEQGRLRLHGGAGGATSVGGALALWPPVALFIVPIAGCILYFVGYASVATMSAPLITTVVFIVMAWMGKLPWEYVVYGILAELLLLYALRPNIKRLMNGTERLIGWRAKRRAQAAQKTTDTDG